MRLNRNGFTLIELLAVITILGILMIVGIPAVQRTINNSRKDTFLNTAKKYANAVKTAWASDDITCTGGIKPSGVSSDQNFIVWFSSVPSSSDKKIDGKSSKNSYYLNYEKLMQSGGKSSWGSNDIMGFVIVKTVTSTNPEFYVFMVDEKLHGVVIEDYKSDDLAREHVVENAHLPDMSDAVLCNVDNG